MRDEKGQKPRLPEGARLGVDPPDRTERMRFLLVWAKPGQEISCVLLSDEPLWCEVHFDGGQSFLCEGPACPRCAAGDRSLRKQGYLSAAVVGKKKPCILMVPAGLRQGLFDLAARKGGLRGLKVRVIRTREDVQSACRLVYDDDWRSKTLPRAANLAYCVPVLFGYLPPEGASEWDDAPAQVEQQQQQTVRRLVDGVGRPPAGEGGGK